MKPVSSLSSSLSPSQREAHLSRQFLDALKNPRDRLPLEKVKEQEEKASEVLQRSKSINKSRSCERGKRDVEGKFNMPRLSDMRLFRDVKDRSDQPSTTNQGESLGDTKQHLGATGTQPISIINSKYVKRCSHNYTDMHTDKHTDKHKNEHGCYTDPEGHSQSHPELIPFSMVSSYIQNKKPEKEAEEKAGDLTTEIMQAKSNFESIKSENQELKAELDKMQKLVQKIETEKAQSSELNDLKLQQFESRVKLMELQFERDAHRQSHEHDRERR